MLYLVEDLPREVLRPPAAARHARVVPVAQAGAAEGKPHSLHHSPPSHHSTFLHLVELVDSIAMLWNIKPTRKYTQYSSGYLELLATPVTITAFQGGGY